MIDVADAGVVCLFEAPGRICRQVELVVALIVAPVKLFKVVEFSTLK